MIFIGTLFCTHGDYTLLYIISPHKNECVVINKCWSEFDYIQGSWTHLVWSVKGQGILWQISVYWSDHHTDRSEWVEPASVLSPEDSVLKLAAIDAARVPHAIQIRLTTCVVPPATFVEMSAVACREMKDGWKRLLLWFKWTDTEFQLQFKWRLLLKTVYA